MGTLRRTEKVPASKIHTAMLTGLEGRLYSVLRKHGGRIVSRHELMAEVWPQAQYEMNPSTVDRHVASIRKKLPPGIRIGAVYGKGYRFERDWKGRP